MPSSKRFFRTLIRCVAVLGPALIMTAVAAQASTLPSPIRLSDGVTTGAHVPVMALDAKGHLDVAWTQPNGIFFRHSTDGGVTFFNTVEVQALPAGQTAANLQIGVDAAGDITLLWATFTPTSVANLFLSHSTDGGFTFSTPKALVPNFGGTVGPAPALLVHPNGAIDITDFATVNGTTALFSARSADGGASFPAPVQVSVGRGFSIWVAKGLHDQIYVFWSSQFGLAHCDLLFSRSSDGGRTFSSPLNISNGDNPNFDACRNSPMAIVDPAGTIDLIYSLSDPASVFFSRSFDAGVTFSAPKNVFAPLSSLSGSAQIASDPSDTSEVNIAAGSFDPAVAVSSILFTRSSNHGSSFSTPVLLDPNQQEVASPVLALDPHGTISVAWLGANDTDIFFRRSTDDGTTFSNLTNISNSNSFSFDNAASQALMDSHGNAYVLWVGGTNPDVFFSRIPASASLASDFRISVSPKSPTASPGQTLHFQVTAKAVGTHIDVAALSCGSLITLATCTFNPPSVTASPSGGTSTLTLTIPATTQPGTHLFAVNGVGGSTTDTQTVVLTVK